MSDKIFKVYEGTVDAFKATNLPTTYADRPVFIEGDASGNGRAIFANGEYYGNGDAMSERGWRFVKWNSGTSTEYWNRIAKIDALKNSNILLECSVKGEFGYSAAVCFYIDVSSSPSDRITVSVHGGASSIGYNNGSITPMVTVDADLNVWLKLHNMNYTSRAAIRVIYRTGNAEAYGHFGTNESSTSYVYQVAAPASTFLEGYGGLRYTISTGTYTLTGAVIDATATDAKKLGGVDASGYAKIEAIGDSQYVYGIHGLSDSQLLYALPSSQNGDEDDVFVTRGTLKTINGQSLIRSFDESGDITIEGGGSSVYVMVDVMFTDLEEGFSVGQGEFDRIKEAIVNGNQIAVCDDRSTRWGYLYATQTNVLAEEDHINLTFVADDSVYQLSLYENDGLIDYYRIHTIGSSSGSSAMPLVDHGTNGTTSMIAPNVFHKWGEVASLTLTLGAETAGVANQYTFEFASGSTATVLALPDSLKWADDNVPTIEANMIYQISILNGLAVVLKFKNAKLITNNLTVSGTTLTFDYPVASNVQVQVQGGGSTNIATFNEGDQTKSVMLGPGVSVEEVLGIIPPEDSVYKYVYNA